MPGPATTAVLTTRDVYPVDAYGVPGELTSCTLLRIELYGADGTRLSGHEVRRGGDLTTDSGAQLDTLLRALGVEPDESAAGSGAELSRTVRDGHLTVVSTFARGLEA